MTHALSDTHLSSLQDHARQWLHRASRTPEEKQAYLEGITDAYTCNYTGTTAGAYPAHQAEEALDAILYPGEPEPPAKPAARPWLDRFLAARVTYNYCSICGYQPKNQTHEPNRAPLKFWDCDDGWKIGTLCRPCAPEALEAQPKPTDYAYDSRGELSAADVDTDEDPIEAL